MSFEGVTVRLSRGFPHSDLMAP